MNNWIVIAVFAGIASAAMVASVVVGSPMAAPLVLFAPLPLFIAGFGWGPVAAAVGGIAGAALLAVGVSFGFGANFVLSVVLAPVVLAHLALINRPAGGRPVEGEAQDDQLEWYPEGRLILWAAAITFVIATTSVFVFGDGGKTLEANIDTFFSQMVAQLEGTTDPARLEQIKQSVPAFKAMALPVGGMGALLVTLLNVTIASRVLTASGRSLRPWAPFASYNLPKSAGLALVAAIAALFLTGTLGKIATMAFMLIMAVFTIIGLAALHGLMAGSRMQGFVLATVYLALVVLTWVVMLPLVVLALVDQHFNLRGRQSAAAGTLND